MMRRKWLYGWAVNEGVVEHEKGEEDRVESSEEGHGGSMWGLEESRRGRGKESLRRSHDIGGGRRVSSEEGLVKIPEVEAVEELSEDDELRSFCDIKDRSGSVGSLTFSSDDLYESNERVEHFYDIEDVIGYGMDVVLLGIAKGTSMKVAIKRVSKLRSFEVEVLRNSRHENLVSIYGIHSSPAEDFVDIVMENMRGGDLFNFLSTQGHVSEKTVCSVIKQVLFALSYIHGRGIVHCDLKAENVLLDGREPPLKVKLADFGISQRVSSGKTMINILLPDNLEEQLTPVGTPGYVAPELCEIVLRGESVCFCPTTAIDLFACGVLLYVMLSGTFPDFYFGENATTVYEKTAAAEFSMAGKKWDNVSDEAKDLVRGLLEKDPEERFTADQALSTRWIRGEVSEKPIGNDLSSINQTARKLGLCAYMLERSRSAVPRRRHSALVLSKSQMQASLLM